MEKHFDKAGLKMKKIDAVLILGMVIMVLTFFAFSIWGCISAYSTIYGSCGFYHPGNAEDPGGIPQLQNNMDKGYGK